MKLMKPKKKELVIVSSLHLFKKNKNQPLKQKKNSGSVGRLKQNTMISRHILRNQCKAGRN